MSQIIKLKKGFNINLVGKPEKKILETDFPETFAVKPTDFAGISRPKLLVKEGDTVKAGSPLMYDKQFDTVMYCAPVSGEVIEINRGEKRKLLEIKILADKKIDYLKFKKYSVSDITKLKKEDASAQIQKSGLWPQLIQRPYGIVANPSEAPKSIFISGFDTHPLAPDYNFLIDGEDQNFQIGLDILRKLTTGEVHLSINNNAEISQVFAHAKGVQLHKISGPHPAGNVGIQIHHVNPINKGDLVWTIDPIGVVQLGKLFLEGIYDASKLVALTGSEVSDPAYIKTLSGAPLNKLLDQKVEGTNVRYISGNVLTGENIGKNGYLGYYHHQVTVIPEGDHEELFGWILPSTKKLSFHRSFGLSLLKNAKKEYKVDTNTHGEHRNFVMTGVFEKVVPMDILPTYLFKAILAEDYDEMEALGIYELVEEDIALCEFIDVSKNDLQHILRDGIELIRNS